MTTPAVSRSGCTGWLRPSRTWSLTPTRTDITQLLPTICGAAWLRSVAGSSNRFIETYFLPLHEDCPLACVRDSSPLPNGHGAGDHGPDMAFVRYPAKGFVSSAAAIAMIT